MVDGLLYFPTLFVKQKPRGWWVEMFTGCEIENKYKVYNPHGPNPKDEMLVAMEESTCCCRQCCGAMREFRMPITTMENKEVCRLERPFRCGRRGGMCCCACDGCFQSVSVFTGKDCREPNKFVGRVREEYSCWLPILTVRDDHDSEVYRIVGDCCIGWSYELRIFNPGQQEGTQIGRIKKKWSGIKE